MKKILDNIPLILLGLVVLGVVIALSPILIVGFLIFFLHKYIQNKKSDKVLDQYLSDNAGKMFFCYTTKKNYKIIFNQGILPQLNPDIIPLFYQGGHVQNHKDWFILENIIKGMNRGKGYPAIFYFTKKNVHFQSFGDTYKHFIAKEKDYARFVEIIHRAFERFGATFSSPHPTAYMLDDPKMDFLSNFINMGLQVEPEPEEKPKSNPFPPNFRQSI